ncbi:hypothetical protein BABINDRAFT_158996 [Babjeviella inositovora NRRL Y-12698]|uniref:AMP-dependent synthetase/ligase domain-containing protein n=1 Tax=Babjeviella inositovora NRRL Y-12698 TaxID=984486 RepID=A0A1E3QXQ1_9ASCO|nr:uncharacterized protein BABINDRAFT_158996 [Babjeviella inositovora NRRL Y-12698]ODQ82391.1 hypothetical protein BABINDRAFT_158996 [Babjeviella inositovora NRRL Y-12698]
MIVTATTSVYPHDYTQVKALIHAMPPPTSLVDTAVALPDSAEPGYSPVYRNRCARDGLYATLHPALTTLHDAFEYARATYATQPCLGARLRTGARLDDFYTWETYEEVYQRKNRIGAGLLYMVHNCPFQPTTTPFIVTLFSVNNTEWALTDLACQSYSLCNTALYPTLGPDTSQYILELTDSPIVVCSADKLDYLLDLKARGCPRLTVLVLQTGLVPLVRDAIVTRAHSLGVTVLDLADLEAIGEANPHPFVPPTPNTLYTISFTSGTTGSPKGVMLEHRQAMAHVLFLLTVAATPKGRGTALCSLPLAHIYQRCLIIVNYLSGIALGFPQSSSPKTLVDDLRVLKPCSLASVPRVVNRIEADIKALTVDSESAVTRAASRLVIARKMAQNEHGRFSGIDYLSTQAFRHVYGLRARFGLDECRFMQSGSAPVAPETIRFLRAALDIGYTNAYGLTELAAGICRSFPFEGDYLSTGPVGITCEARLKDVPEMGYTSTDKGGARGELLLRGPQIFVGYYKNPGETEKALLRDGWFHTGDIARIGRGGRIHIIDRLKNFFKLAQGEYITPERIENLYMSSCSGLVAQLFVHGDSLETYLIGIVGVDPVGLVPFFEKNFGIVQSVEGLMGLLKKPKYKRRFLMEMNALVTGFGLQGFEKLHNIQCKLEPMSVENNLVTPSLKIKRQQCRTHFEPELRELYVEGSLLKEMRL